MKKYLHHNFILLVYATILTICNPLYFSKLSANELIINEKPGFLSPFEDEKGDIFTLSDFKGKLLLVNLWATWCEPCKDEIPSLEELQKNFDKNTFLVLPINLDRGPKKKSITFFKQNNINNLKGYFDDKNEIPREVKILGLPVSIIIDQNGIEIARLIGPEKWNSEYFINYIKGNLF